MSLMFGNKIMNKYHYSVSTFKDNELVQFSGDIEAENVNKAIQKLTEVGVLDDHGCESLYLKKV